MVTENIKILSFDEWYCLETQVYNGMLEGIKNRPEDGDNFVALTFMMEEVELQRSKLKHAKIGYYFYNLMMQVRNKTKQTEHKG